MGLFSHKHRPVSGWAGTAPYGRLAYRGTDGLGICHVAVVVRCVECGKDFDVAMFHTTDATLSTHEEARKPMQTVLEEREAIANRIR